MQPLVQVCVRAWPTCRGRAAHYSNLLCRRSRLGLSISYRRGKYNVHISSAGSFHFSTSRSWPNICTRNTAAKHLRQSRLGHLPPLTKMLVPHCTHDRSSVFSHSRMSKIQDFSSNLPEDAQRCVNAGKHFTRNCSEEFGNLSRSRINLSRRDIDLEFPLSFHFFRHVREREV